MSMCNSEHATQPNWKSGHSELLKTLLRTESEEEAVELGEPWKTKFADLEVNNAVRDASGQGCKVYQGRGTGVQGCRGAGV